MKYLKGDNGHSLHAYDEAAGKLTTTTVYGTAVYTFASPAERAEMLQAVAGTKHDMIDGEEYAARLNAMKADKRIKHVAEMRKAEG